MSDDITEGYLAARTDANMAGSEEYQQLTDFGLDAADILTNGEKQTYPEGAPILAHQGMQGMVANDGSQASPGHPVNRAEVPVEPNNQQMTVPKASVKKPETKQLDFFGTRENIIKDPVQRENIIRPTEFGKFLGQHAEAGQKRKFGDQEGAAGDIVMGMVRGSGMALNETFQAIQSFSEYLNKNFVDVTKVEKAIADFLGVPENWEKYRLEFDLADTPETAAGKMSEGLSQFLVGFAGAGKVLNSYKVFQRLKNGNSFAQATLASLKGMMADFVAFDPHAPNMSSWLNQTWFKNPVTEFLDHKIGESELTGRLKNTVEGGILGAGIDLIVHAAKVMKGVKAAQIEVKQAIDMKEHEKFFNITDDTQIVSLDDLNPSRAREKGIKNARKYMDLSAKGEQSKRAPISVRDNMDGTYTVLDGNSTFAVGKEKGWETIPVRILTDAQFKVEDAAAKAAKSGGGVTPAASSSSSKAKGESSIDPTLGPPGSQVSDVSSQLKTSAPPSSVRHSFENPPVDGLRTAKKDFSVSSSTIPLTPNSKSPKKIYHTQNNFEDLQRTAAEIQPEFERLLRGIADSVPGVTFYGTRLKGTKQIGDKFHAGINPQNVGDYLGGRIIIDNHAAIKKVQEAINSKLSVVEVDNFAKTEYTGRGGYRAIHIQVKSSKGFTAEIQIQNKHVNRVQDVYHEPYKEMKEPRSQMYGQPLAPRSINPGDLAHHMAMYKEMEAAYDEAWAIWARENRHAINEEAAILNASQDAALVTAATSLTIGALGGVARSAARTGVHRSRGQAVAESGHGDEQYTEATVNE
tara:strand:- start:4195 stop:6603 length:2409 start_codon:yes stop_codon:yes gene_type:complete